MVGPKKREMSGIVLNYFYSVGEALVGLLFWLCPDWVILQLIVSVPPLLFIGYYWIVPESVRWLLARKDYTKARKLIRKAAHVNGVELSEHKLEQLELKSPTHSEYVCIRWIAQQPYKLRCTEFICGINLMNVKPFFFFSLCLKCALCAFFSLSIFIAFFFKRKLKGSNMNPTR